MSTYWLNVALFRIVYPTILVGCTIWRPVGLSLAYLALALVSPMIPVPTTSSMNGHTGRFLKASIALSLIASLMQLTFHVVLLALPPYGGFLVNCEFIEELLRHIGLVKLDSASAWEVFFWITPEVVVFPATVFIYVICRRLVNPPIKEDDDHTSLQQRNEKKSKERSVKIINFLGSIGTYVVLATLCCTASLTPSVEGAFYFLVFICSATWWACHRELSRAFAIMCRILMALIGVHILVLLSYQNQWPQEVLPSNGTWARYFAFIPVYETNCTDPRDVDYKRNADWSAYAYSLRLFFLYFLLALQSKFLFKKPSEQRARLSGRLEALDTPLSRHVSIRRRTPSQRWQSARRKARRPIEEPQTSQPNERTPLMRFGSGRTGLLQDSTGSVIVPDGQHEDSIQLQSLSEGVSEEKTGVLEHVVMAVFSVFQLIVNSSYLAMNIIMMTWSIMYHSWTTFVLLLWALILWMVPNKRESMMTCSPFIVVYSTLLVLVQYVYSMNLTDEELPREIYGIQIADIGFKKVADESCWNLVIKCAFLAMFWITMRQHMAEKLRQRRTSALRDMVAPLHVSVTTATAAMNSQAEPEIKSKFMKEVGIVVKKLLTKFWIVVVTIMLFTSGITGKDMTVFRIVYMSLFLIFVITFQISWTVWRKIMYGFWITVIGYSVLMLILVYTYQFPQFPGYWRDYLHVSDALQKDIGLPQERDEKFFKLLIPTFFVIITVLQIHYFHYDFLEITDLKKIIEASRKDNPSHSPSRNPIVSPADVLVSDHDDETRAFTLKELKHMSKLERRALMRQIKNHLKNFYNYVWLFLEIHIQKIIFISIVLMCIGDVCAINFFFILTVTIAINFKRTSQVFVINMMSFAIAILMVIKMLYQIDYIKHGDYDRNCTESFNDNGTVVLRNVSHNMAEWIGMKKLNATNGDVTLPKLLKSYIGIMTVTTFRAIIVIRQLFYRQENNLPLEMPLVMFPNIKRVDADKGIAFCLKFLFNHGFYKFGLEFCLIGMIILIGTRLDFYSVLYSIWLMILFSLNRKTTSRVWPFLKFFAITLLPLQYFFTFGPPSWLCIDYSWRDSAMLQHLQDWMFLPDSNSKYQPNSKKLICDFMLLFMIVRQSLVFQIEQRCLLTGQEFVAGHNYSVCKDIEKPNFVNPVKDYVSHIHNWLDVFKRGTMMTLMWVTLSIMFLAGTKRTNLFSLGYLIGSFVFLWQGSDFYLRPVKSIIKWWNILIGYNVLVIFCKAIFQGIGCVILFDLEYCTHWVLQLLGIACLKELDISKDKHKCEVDRDDIGMLWDGLCFGFLLFQKRLFRSYYFFHIVDETKAMSILASRGAELLEELHQKRIAEQENIEKAELQKIKFKMDKIKANQRKIHGPGYKEPRTHKIDNLYREKERPTHRHWNPKTHVEAVRSGDYYMFDDVDDNDLTDLFPDKDISEEEAKRKEREQKTRRMTISELMDTLIKTDIEIATHVALYGGSQKDAMRMRRRSVPLTRKKSSMSYLSARSETDTAQATDLPEQETVSSADEDPTEHEIDDEFDKETEKDSKEESKSKEEGEPKVSVLTYFKFLWALINSSMVSMTGYLNCYSNDYRYVRKVLAKEKKLLKAKPDFRIGARLGISQIWQPLPIVKQRLPAIGSSDDIVEDPGEGPSNRDDQSPKGSLFIPTIPRIDEDEEELSEVDQPPIIQLAASIWFGILAHSTFLCYFMVFLHQIKNASILSTPLPLMVFLWGSLTIPRPSKTFWITLIAYVEIIVIIKCICQPEFLSWNKKEMSSYPFEIPRILGVERKKNYALWDLLLLLVVFFHRFMLKSLGQWTTPSLKSRKVIPTGVIVATVKQASINDENKPEAEKKESQDQAAETNEEIHEIKTPQGMILSLPTNGEAEGDIQSSPPTGDNERLVVIQTTERNLVEEEFQKALRLTTTKYIEPIKTFLSNILDPSGKEKTNVYAYMFLCDFFNFILLIFGFSSFGAQQGDGGVATYFAENRVPMPFLLMLLVQFALIVIDRALFLKKSIGGKLSFQYALVVGVHIWMFIFLPSATERSFNTKVIPQIWYMVKCFYLLLAAYQLRLGYPTRILGNFLCKKYTIVNYVLFKGFMVVPFLFEMRAVMDWIWTDTSMTVMDWFKMEDIFANIYQIKCMRGLEDDYPQERGMKKTQMSKYLVGGGALFLMIGMIWFPLLLFALGSTVGIANLPNEVNLNIRIGSYEPIYTIAAQNSSITQYSESNFNDLKELYESTHRDRSAVTFLENYENTDVAAVKLSTDSGKLWSISPPDRERLKEELESNNTVMIHVEWMVTRKRPSKDNSGVTINGKDISLEPYVNGKRNPVREGLLCILNGGSFTQLIPANNTTAVASPEETKQIQIRPCESNGVLLKNVLPMFLKVTSRGTSVVPQLVKPLIVNKKIINYDVEDEESQSYLYRNVTLAVTNNSINQQWFKVHEICDDAMYTSLNEIPLNNCSYITMFLFNDKVFPEELSFISGLGIFGLYTTAVILVSSFIKRMVSDMAPKIMFEDLPYVDRILKLCLDIYLVRESGDLCLEEDLFAKLVFLYRSPETLIRWTRPPDTGEQIDGEDDDQNYNDIDDNGGRNDDDDDDDEETNLRRRLRSDDGRVN